ncbi:MAG: UDP-N-acetylmuramate dehydrogenase [Nitrospinae bacterium]|nr:UDP-N-acetylmuramate dehydrogenase [Nitrospinota bacterium]
MKKGLVEVNAPLAGLTTFGIGGPADRLVFPATAEEAGRWIRSGEVSLILGGGSNTLVSDAGVRGTALCLAGVLAEVEFLQGPGGQMVIEAQAGVSFTKLAVAACRQSLSGLEFAHGIPGTVGGAIVMNAGTRDGEVKDVLLSATVVTREGETITLGSDDMGFAYRSSALPKDALILSCRFVAREGDRARIKERMRQSQLARKASQPLDIPSAGSVFKNPPGDYAGRLIEAAGLKGTRIGGARVSEKHANFIVNEGGATARDVRALMKLAQDRVYEMSGVKLAPEIKLVGEFDE